MCVEKMLKEKAERDLFLFWQNYSEVICRKIQERKSFLIRSQCYNTANKNDIVTKLQTMFTEIHSVYADEDGIHILFV